ncbi:tetratricopeptide repeat protein [Streptomyces sp. NPDC090108]|uniref:tetratricopeptide repeat protein n=1 Tax=Streptomyces sp. NPDC090108 TaxID=3365947 RepID=UPI003812F21C
MENRQYDHRSPGTSLVAEPPPGRSRRRLRRVLIATLVTGAAAGAVLVLLPLEGTPGGPHPRRPAAGAGSAAPAAGPPAQVLTAVVSGVPAALPDLTSLIGRQESTVRARPRDARAWAVLGAAYVQRGRLTADAADYPKAETALRTSLEVRGTGNAEALAGMTALANARRDFPSAERYGEQALKLTPKQWAAYPPLIDAYTGLGDYEKARSTLDKLMGLRTAAADRPAVMARASAVYRDRGWREDAVAQLTDAAAAAGTPAEQAAYLTGLGQLAWERGDLDDALRHFEGAVRLDPGRREALAGKGRTLAALGRTPQALDAYRAALAGQPDARGTLELGELYESLGMTREAQAQYELLQTRLRQAAAGGVDEELVAGRFEADHGDPGEAVARLEEEYERQPGIEVTDALGWALHRAGDDQEALAHAVAATDRTKGGGVRSALYAFHRGVIEQELGLDAPARRHLQEALRVNPYFSPLYAPAARAALRELGDVPEEPLPAGA